MGATGVWISSFFSRSAEMVGFVAISFYLVFLGLFSPQRATAQGVPYTGNAIADFTSVFGAVRVVDPGGLDVGLPAAAPPGTISGWDMRAIYFYYDLQSDSLSIGIDCYGICGDADGDGNPNVTSNWLRNSGGRDIANWNNTESFAIVLDTDDNGMLDSGSDVVLGLPVTPTAGNFSTLRIAIFDGSPFFPQASFGAQLPNPVTAFVQPDAARPDLELTIGAFSTLPNFTFTPGEDVTFGMTVFMGSFNDAGIGEDFIPDQESVVRVELKTPQRCYTISDSDKTTSSDELYLLNAATGESFLVGALGTLDVEAAALVPGGTTLYAANGGQLGTVDTMTATFTARPQPFGTASGAAGSVLLSDVDGLSFDPLTGAFYGVHRTVGSGTPDLLFRIDPTTGAHLPQAFGPATGYVQIPLLLGLESIDDIAIDPFDGQMYGIANDDPTGFADRLVRIDKATGAVSDVGAFGVIDVEGLAFSNSGRLFASTGVNGTLAGRDRLFEVDKSTGLATEVGPLPSSSEDYEALTCLSAGINVISGTVFVDADRDGLHDQPPEVGAPGVTVRLYRDVNGDGLVDGGDVLLATQITDAAGDYSFGIAAAGAFVVDVDVSTLPLGYGLTTDNVETAFFLGFGNIDPDNDFGFVTGAVVGDRVWLDFDGDGVQDAAEPGLGGVSVELYTETGVLVQAAVSDAAGAYYFGGLLPGRYYVRFLQPVGFILSPKDRGGNEALDSDADVNGATDFFTLVTDQIRTDLDAGLVPGATLGDFVWHDLDADGLQDPGEPGLAGVTVELLRATGTVVASTTTDGGGLFLFSGVAPGNYRLRFTSPAGFSFSRGNVGADDDVDSDADGQSGLTDVITLAPGETALGWDAGLFGDQDGDKLPDDVEGEDDRDGDGIPNDEDFDPTGYFYDEDTGEILSGGGVVITGPGAIDLLLDGSTGRYQFFTDGTPGIYTVRIIPPPGYASSSTCLRQDPPPFDPTGGPDPTVLGNDEDGSSGFLTTNACTSFYLTFDLDAGDPFIIENNFPFTRLACSLFTLSQPEAQWRYLDDGSNQGTAWRLPAFDDSTWALGNAELGYGDGDEATVVSFGGDPANKPITTYFRRTFVVPDPTVYTGLTIRLKRDDGAVVYLNGIEVLRSNMPAGAISFATPAAGDAVGPAEAAFFAAAVDPALLVAGSNLLAVEVHQVDPTSADLSFDLELLGDSCPVATCYGAADGGDRLVQVSSDGQVIDIGPLGVADVEAIGGPPDGAVLYGADAGQLGLISLLTGAFVPTGSLFGSGTGAVGVVGFDDVDSLALDPLSGVLYGVQRRLGDGVADLLFQIDRTTGALVPAAFGPGVDYVEIAIVAGLEDIDDIAIDPNDGQMYGVANEDGTGLGDRLVRIDSLTGAAVDVGAVGVDDLEGLAFYSDGRLFGSSGDASGPGTSNTWFQLDLPSGQATVRVPFPSYSDYEGLTCQTGGRNTITGTVFSDADADGLYDPPGEIGVAGVSVRLYRDLDNNGRLDPGDLLIQRQTTAADGSYAFEVAASGSFVVDVDPATLPAGSYLTTDNLEGASFSDFGNLDPDNDFGLTLGAMLGDYTWLDINGDGVQDAGEEPVSGVVVELYDGADNLIATRTTDAAGLYLFTGVPPGVYYIRFLPPIGRIFTTRDQGDDARDSDPLVTFGETSLFRVFGGTDDRSFDAGFQPSPAEALVSSFTAYEADGEVIVEWATSSEAGTAGFYLYRPDPATGEPAFLHRGMLPGLITAPAGGTYRLRDPNASPDLPYAYGLMEIETSGNVVDHGLFRGAVELGRPAEPDVLTDDYEARAHPIAAAQRLRLEARRAEQRRHAEARPLAAVEAMKIAVRSSGFYQVESSAIATYLNRSAEEVERLIASNGLALSLRGRQVAWLPAVDGRGMLFYGEAIDSPFTAENVYRLSPGRGLQMTSLALRPPQAVVGGSFHDETTAEENRFPATTVGLDPASDFWFWDFLIADDPTLGSKDFSLPARDPVATTGDAALTVHLVSATESGTASEHRVEVRIEGALVGTAHWGGIGRHEATFLFPQTYLQGGGATVTLTARLDDDVPLSIIYLDRLQLSYERTYRAAGDALLLRADHQSVVTVRGFTSPAVQVLELSDALRPRRVTGINVEGAAGGGYQVSFRAAAATTSYLAVSAGGLRTPARLVADQPVDLRSSTLAAEYVVIAPPELVAAAEDLAALRRQRGLSTLVVDRDDVYDAFNHGIASPHALRSFLAHAYRTWRIPPRFAVLAGEGTLDYKDHLGLGGNLLPPLMHRTPHGLFATDIRLGDVVGEDGVPEIAIGRLPVLTAAELIAVVHKIAAHEAESNAAPLLFLADNADGGGVFPTVSNRLAERLPAGVSYLRIHLGELGPAAARQQVFAALDAGVAYVSYLGHGGLDRLADERLLGLSDVPALTPTNTPPILSATSCAINRFTLPGFTSLGEALVRRSDGGAIAVWAPSGLAFAEASAALEAALLDQLTSGAKTLGEALRGALATLAAEGGPQPPLSSFLLLGDPALAMP